jgi:hypothetical protein
VSTSTSPYRIDIQFFTKRYLRTKGLLDSFLDLLETKSFLIPTKYGQDGHPKLKYTKEAFKADFMASSGYDLLFRDRNPKHDIILPTNESRLDAFDFSFKPSDESQIAEFYQLSVDLAELFEPVFGTAQSDWNHEDSEEILRYRRSSGLSKPQFSSGGPAGFATRTWFGSDLVKMIGKKPFEDLKKPLMWTNYGGCYVDTVNDITKTDLSTLIQEQQDLTNMFADINIFGDYSKFYNAKPGINWVNLRKDKNLF